jgi:plasmid stabilization system protein ParE
MRVDWSDLAHEQLDDAMAYIARDRPATATRWLEQLLDAAKRDDIRELVVGPYRVIYRRDEDAVYVTMVVHVRRHLDLEGLE